MNLEELLTHPLGFAVTEASPAQRAICRMVMGEPLGELASLPVVAEMIGGPGALAKLPTKPPRIVCLGAAVRCGKSSIVAAKALRNAYEGDCSGLKHGEIPRVSIVSVDLDKARETFSKLRGALVASPALASLLLEPPKSDSILVRNRSGWPVEIKMVAGAAAGNTLVARWSLGAIFDEAPRMLGQSDGVVNLDDALSALRARMRAGAQIDLVGSLWAPRGPVFKLVQERFGKPGEDVLVILATGPQLRPELYTPEYCERIKADDDRAYETDVMCRFAEPESRLIPFVHVTRALRDHLEPPAHIEYQHYVAVMDPATRGNGWTLVLLTSPAPGSYQVVLCAEWIGTRSSPLKASKVLREIAELLEPYGLYEVVTDQYGFDVLKDLADVAQTGLSLLTSNRSDDLAGPTLCGLLADDNLSLPPDDTLRADLISLARKPRQRGGSQIVFPLTADGRHCDYGAALLLAMQHLPEPPSLGRVPRADDDELRLCQRLQHGARNPVEAAGMRLLNG